MVFFVIALMRIGSTMTQILLVQKKRNIMFLLTLQWNVTQIFSSVKALPVLWSSADGACREKFTHGSVQQTGPEREDAASHLKARQASSTTNISDRTVTSLDVHVCLMNTTNDWPLSPLDLWPQSANAGRLRGFLLNYCSWSLNTGLKWTLYVTWPQRLTHTFLSSDWTLVTSSHDPRPASVAPHGKHIYMYIVCRKER